MVRNRIIQPLNAHATLYILVEVQTEYLIYELDRQLLVRVKIHHESTPEEPHIFEVLAHVNPGHELTWLQLPLTYIAL